MEDSRVLVRSTGFSRKMPPNGGPTNPSWGVAEAPPSATQPKSHSVTSSHAPYHPAYRRPPTRCDGGARCAAGAVEPAGKRGERGVAAADDRRVRRAALAGPSG